jgi:uncharacterized protein with GYD domain
MGLATKYRCVYSGISPDRRARFTHCASRKSGATVGQNAARAGPAGVQNQCFRPIHGEGNAMPTYVTLYKYTAQGIQNIKDAPNRVETLTKAATQAGMKVKETLWLQGEYDFIAIVEAPDEIAATAFNINNLKQGNVTTHTMRAFTSAEMKKILEHVA